MIRRCPRAIETHRLPVYSNVIYLRPDAGRNDLGKFTQQTEHHNISIEYQVLRLIDLDGQQVLDSRLVGLVPLTLLMGHKAGITDEEWIRRCVQCKLLIALMYRTRQRILEVWQYLEV